MHLILLSCVELWHFYSILFRGLLFSRTQCMCVCMYALSINFRNSLALIDKASSLHVDVICCCCCCFRSYQVSSTSLCIIAYSVEDRQPTSTSATTVVLRIRVSLEFQFIVFRFYVMSNLVDRNKFTCGCCWQVFQATSWQLWKTSKERVARLYQRSQMLVSDLIFT